MKLKIGHCQLQCTAGDTAANVDRVLAGLEEAASEHIDILSFPECFLTGYFRSAEQAWEHSFRVDSPEIADLLRRTVPFETTFIVGFNEPRGRELYNTAVPGRKNPFLAAASASQSRVRERSGMST